MSDHAPVEVVGLSTPAETPEELIGYAIDEPRSTGRGTTS
jgi:hypothetical protein